MSCPFFKEANVGYCSANDYPYIPSIRELEQQCFKDSFKSCSNFNNLSSTEQNRMAEFNISEAL
jgi:hypothetical protein